MNWLPLLKRALSKGPNITIANQRPIQTIALAPLASMPPPNLESEIAAMKNHQSEI